MNFTFVGTGTTTSPSFLVTDPANRFQDHGWHYYLTGTFGASGAVQVQYSPDTDKVADASSRWISPTALKLTAAGDAYFTARCRKIRFVLSGGDGTTNLVAELV